MQKKIIRFVTVFIVINLFLLIDNKETYSQNWVMQSSGTIEDLYSVKAVNANVAWACGTGGTAIRTTNKGTNWGNVSSPIWGVNDLYHVFAIDEDTAYVLANPSAGAYIYKTTNGGSNWRQVFFQSDGFLNSIYLNGLNGFTAGDPVGGKWTILKTTDSGETWFRMTTEPIAESTSHYGYNNSFQVMGNQIWFSTNASRVYYSTDAGETWSFAATSFVSSYDLQFNSAANGIVAGTGIQKTSDGGVSYNSVTCPGSGSFGALAGALYGCYWAGRGTNIYYTWQGGDIWRLEYSMPSGANIYAMDFVSFNYGFSQAGWAVTAGGKIAAFNDLINVPEVNLPKPENFVLNPNYPNPFNPSTVIRYQLAVSSKVTLKIYSALGQEVRTLVNKQQSAGMHSITWDGKNNHGQRVSSGVYLYRLEAGGFVKTRKMVLVE